MFPRKQFVEAFSRRQFVRVGAASILGVLLTACGLDQLVASESPATAVGPTVAPTPNHAVELPPASSGTLPATPYCDDEPAPTLPDAEGPFYTPDTPQRASFLDDRTHGLVLVVRGRVLGMDCRPIANAMLDFWHTDEDGNYDNEGYRFRGHQFSDENGLYQLESVLPGLYPGRTRHIHVRVQGLTTPLLTTQLYFPGEPRNGGDALFQEPLLMEISQSAGTGQAVFDFVLSDDLADHLTIAI